ncbi:hypothetical protein Pmani_004440 [Petrolisthes manimaculis]|uniref:protein-tyrosine-phosphatase n=1 Tax=Petrolisthes manimaculis TaxID=1843537 RepID=A0AAE1ULJ6_9EUCA|nr:hypothetical protein Pmani_004440 [Petrolisthes manimaculis]
MEKIKVLTPSKLSMLVRSDKALIIDSRTFCEYNTSHIINSINVWSSKIRKKRLQQDSISVHDYLGQACQLPDLTSELDIIVYDQNAPSLSAIPQDSFLHVLLNKLGRAFPRVYLLAGGFLEFQARFPELCEDSSQKCTPLTTQSQPCMPVANVGPTRILPFLYLGSQQDANNRQLLQDYNILYELNVSVSCPKPDFVQDSHFMRIPVNDNFSEKLLPYFSEAFNFIDKVRESGGCVLVHCLAGISRSATVAIAYVMKHLSLPFDEAYMYVKTRRPTISPNINFVGQLAELDRQLKRESGPRDPASAPIIFRSNESSISRKSTTFASSFLEHHACAEVQSGIPKSLSLNLKSTLEAVPASPSSTPHTPPGMSPATPRTPQDMSPSTALARLSFASALEELRDDGLPITSKCPSPATPVTPKTAIIREMGNTPSFSFRNHPCDSPKPSSPSSSPNLSSVYKSKEVSSRTKSDYRSEAKIGSFRESFTTSDSSKSTSNSFYTTATFSVGKENVEDRTRLRGEERGNPGRRTVQERGEDLGRIWVEDRRKSLAEIGRGREKEMDEKMRRLSVPVQSSFTRRPLDKERQVSVCVIDVKRENSPVRFVRSEPLIVRETPVMATPCNVKPEVRSVLEVELENGKQKEEHISIPEETRRSVEERRFSREIASIRSVEEKQGGTEKSNLVIEKDEKKSAEEKSHRPREVIVPIQIARENRPRVLELNICTPPKELHPVPATAPVISSATAPITAAAQVPATAPVTSSESIIGTWSPESPQEAAIAPPPATPSPSSPGVQQSDSGIIVEETRHSDLPPSPQRLPRCYSSSETHLNTRRLLEHRNPDFTTRKCSSYDEVGRAWPHALAPHHHHHHHQQHSPHHNHPSSVGRDSTNTTTPNTTWLCPWELARSDSVSTSGFGSEISDTDFAHDDAHSTSTQDDALGPYDAVFADVYPGESQQRQNQPTTPKTPRPASLPGVTGAYFSQFEANTDPGLDMGIDVGSSGGVELRQGGRGRRGVEKKDSGYYSFITEHPPVSPRTMGEGVRHTTNVQWPKERPRDLRLQVTPSVVSHSPSSPSLEPLKTHNAPILPCSTTTTLLGETKTSPEKRMTPEKRKSRGSSIEENEEKRRSCEVEPHQWTPPRQTITIGAGTRMAQELLRDVEQLLDSEMGELRRRTAAISSSLRLLGRSDTSSDGSSSLSSPRSTSSISGNSSGSSGVGGCSKCPNVPSTHIIVTTLEENNRSSMKGGKKTGVQTPHRCPEPSQGGNRARSEPPFPGEEGLYRARSCPGLPRPSANSEDNETVCALMPDLHLVRLRGTRQQPSRDKFLNRYSCGALDSHQPAPASAFESCPDFGNLRHCVREGDSIHSSSSSLSSTHSSFTRLLQVS